MTGEKRPARERVVVVGPVFPYRAGIAYCTTRLAEELGKSFDVSIASFRRQYPKRLYPGRDDVDPSLESKKPPDASFRLDILNPLSWLREGMRLRSMRPDFVLLVWWIWVWAVPYLVILAPLRRSTRIVLQCHNIGDKEPAWWKSWLTNRVLNRGDVLIVHARTEAEEARSRTGVGVEIVETFLPVHELGRAMPDRPAARKRYGLGGGPVALLFGHVRPFKGLDVALEAVAKSRGDWTLFVAGEVWWDDERRYREMIARLGIGKRVLVDFRFIPDDEIAAVFAACDVVVAPYRREAQSGVALTAFHFGRPVIATRVGGLPEIIEEGGNGLLVPPEDPVALGAALDHYFSGDREEMERGAVASARRYSWERYAAVIAASLGSVSGEPSRDGT